MGLFGTIKSILNHKSLKATRNLFILQTVFSLSVIVTKIPLGKLLYSLEFYCRFYSVELLQWNFYLRTPLVLWPTYYRHHCTFVKLLLSKYESFDMKIQVDQLNELRYCFNNGGWLAFESVRLSIFISLALY